MTFPFTCRDGHIEIGFAEEAPNGDERCPLCLLRDQVILEVAQPQINYEEFNLQLVGHAHRSYPYKAND